jgi:uncharacterized protein (DUF486 family)
VLVLIGGLTVASMLMTVAWFGHLRDPEMALWQAVLFSWLIAGLEYVVAVPVVRYAYDRGISAAVIEISRVGIALIVFAGLIGLLVTRTGLGWRFVVAAILVVAAIALVATPQK